jgi:hypothetical protein
VARIRSIKPQFWTSEQIADCLPITRLMFIGLWNFCDDGGNHPASPKTLKGEVFPTDNISAETIAELIGELFRNGLLIEYEVDGKRYWHVTGWHHQKIDQPTFKHPCPDGSIPKGPAKRRRQNSANYHNAPSEPSPNVREVFAEQSPNDRGTSAENSTPDGKVDVGVEKTHVAPSTNITPAAEVCVRLKTECQLPDVSPSHPKLLAALEAGLTSDEIVEAGKHAKAKGKGLSYALTLAEGRRSDATNVKVVPCERNADTGKPTALPTERPFFELTHSD